MTLPRPSCDADQASQATASAYLGKSCEGEHPNLVYDVFPSSWSPNLLEGIKQASPHGNDTISHSFEFDLQEDQGNSQAEAHV